MYFVYIERLDRQKSNNMQFEEILTYRRKDQQRRTESNASIWIGTARAVSHNMYIYIYIKFYPLFPILHSVLPSSIIMEEVGSC